MQEAIVALGESSQFFANCPRRNSPLLRFFFFFFRFPTFRREQVPAVTCNGLRRGDWMCPTSSAIKSSGSSFGVPPLRISVQRVFSWGPFRCFSAFAKFRCSSQAPVAPVPPSLIKARVNPAGMFCLIGLRLRCFILCSLRKNPPERRRRLGVVSFTAAQHFCG